MNSRIYGITGLNAVTRMQGQSPAILAAVLICLAVQTAGAVEEMPELSNYTLVTSQGPWISVADLKNETVKLFDEFGNQIVKIDLKGKGYAGIGVSADNSGNCIITRGGAGEGRLIAYYYSKTGQLVWEKVVGYNGGTLILSPNGKYYMNTMNAISDLKIISADDSTKVKTFTLDKSEGKTYYQSHFAKDNAVIVSALDGMVYRLNPENGSIENNIQLTANDGEVLTPIGNEWAECFYSNKEKTVFAQRVYRASESSILSRTNWLLVFDENLDVKLLEEDSCNISDIKVFDSCVVLSRSKASKPGQGRSKILRRYDEKKERVLDQQADDDLGITIQTDSSFYFYNSPKKGVSQYNMQEHKLTKNLPGLPLFKPKKGKPAIRVKVVKE